jgi:hypothetical protein
VATGEAAAAIGLAAGLATSDGLGAGLAVTGTVGGGLAMVAGLAAGLASGDGATAPADTGDGLAAGDVGATATDVTVGGKVGDGGGVLWHPTIDTTPRTSPSSSVRNSCIAFPSKFRSSAEWRRLVPLLPAAPNDALSSGNLTEWFSRTSNEPELRASRSSRQAVAG